MLRLAVASVLLLSIMATSQTATPIGIAPTDYRATASSSLPDAPSMFRGPNTTDGTGDLSGTRIVSPPLAAEPNTSSRRYTLDREFILLHSLSAVALVADLETTAHLFTGQPKATELNPLFGKHPTRARLYGIAVPLDALSFYMSYRAKKAQPKRSLWRITPGVSIAVHSAAAINNLIVAHR